MIRDANVFGPPWRADEAVASRERVLEDFATWLDSQTAENAAEIFESCHLILWGALYDGKFTPDEANEWRERIDRRYEEVTGQPAPPPPPNPLEG